MSEIELKEKVISAMKDKRFDYRSPSGLAKQLKVSIDEVIRILENCSDLIAEGPFLSASDERTYCLRSCKSEWSRCFDLFATCR